MVETPRSMQVEGEWEVSVFECAACGIDFFTEDHVPLTGVASPRVGARFIAAMRRMVLHTITPTQH
jgi:hypothetical protein